MANIFEIFDQIKNKKNAGISGKIEYLLVGLGNPGLEYERTRHNAGFMALDAVAAKYGVTVNRMKFKGMTGEGMIEGVRCLFLKPVTYMNNSGQAVEEARKFYKIPMDHVIIFYDDISLSPGKLRIRRKGTHGGHNGIRDIIELSGEEGFPRVKIGVGAKPNPQYNLADWVLSKFTEPEMEELKKALDVCPDIAALLVKGNPEEAMNRYNS